MPFLAVAIQNVRSRLDDEIAAAGEQCFDVFDVTNRARHVNCGLVIGAERTGPSLRERTSALWPEFFEQPLLQPILPSPGKVGDHGFKAADDRSLWRIGKEAEMEARRVSLAERQMEIDQRAVERGGQSVLDAPA